MSVEALAYVKMLDLGDCENAIARLVMYVIGENTFNDSARCKLTQKQIAFEAGRISDRTLRRHLDALAGVQTDENGRALRDRNDCKVYGEPLFIRQHEQKDPETGARVEDWIEIVGFQDWYREQTKSKKPRTPPVRSSGGTPGQNVQGGRTESPVPPDTAASGPPGQQESGHNESVQVNRTSEDALSARKDSISDFEVKVSAALRAELGAKVFESWFEKVRFSIVDTIARVEAPLPFVRKWILDHYGDLVRRVCRAADAGVSDVDFTIKAKGGAR